MRRAWPDRWRARWAPGWHCESRRRYEGLTASEQKLATLLLDRPDEILTFSATELAGLAGVSKATAARFFRNLGYSDFNDVRLQAREERNRTGPVHQVPMPAEPPEGASTVPTIFRSRWRTSPAPSRTCARTC